MFCKYCGVPVDEDSVFCKSCGKRIDEPNGILPVEIPVSVEPAVIFKPEAPSITVPQPQNISSKILAIAALVFSVVFMGVTNSSDIFLGYSSPSMLVQYAAVFLVIGAYIKGKGGDLLFSTGILLMCFASLGDLTLLHEQNGFLVIIGLVLKLGLILSVIGILNRKRVLSILGGILALSGTVVTNLIYMTMNGSLLWDGENGNAFFALSLLTMVSFTLGVITYKPSNKGGNINVL